MFAMVDADIDAIVTRHMNDANLPGIGVGIFRHGELLYAGTKGVDGHGQMLTETSPLFIGSLSKSLTALAVMQLVEKDLIALDVPVKEYIPYFQVANPDLSQRITVRELLIQQSGLSRENVWSVMISRAGILFPTYKI